MPLEPQHRRPAGRIDPGGPVSGPVAAWVEPGRPELRLRAQGWALAWVDRPGERGESGS
jgi:hypothetical protein